MGNSLSDSLDRLIPFFGKFASKFPRTPLHKASAVPRETACDLSVTWI
jgi:hypothetical protein